MTRFSEAKHRKVLDTSSAGEVGRVDGFVIDVANHRVQALRIGKHKGGSLLAWEDVQGFGPDAVTVRAADDVHEPAKDAGGDDDLLGRLVLTAKGNELGVVEDVEFDSASGILEQVHLSGGGLLAADHLLAIGSYAVIVRPPEATG